MTRTRRARRARRVGLLLACALPSLLGVVTLSSAPAAAAPVRTTVVEDTSVGTGRGQVEYSAGWTQCGGCQPATPNRSFRYSSAAGSTATIRMYGTEIDIYAVREPTGGRMSVSVDGFVPVVVDLYAPTSSVALVYRSGRLSEAEHVFTVVNLGERPPGSTGTVVGFDRADVFTDDTAPTPLAVSTVIEDSTTGTSPGQVEYTGPWNPCGGCTPPTVDSSFRYSNQANATATFRFTGVRLELYGIREPGGGRMAVRLNGNLVRVIDLYQPTSSLAAIYRTEVLPAGNHVVTVANLGQRSAASRGISVGLDRAVIYRDATPPPTLAGVVEDSNVGTGVGQLLYSGAWTICGGCVPPTPNGSFRYSSSAGASVTIRFSGVRLDLYAIRERSGGRMSVSVDGAPPTVVDLYAPASSAPLAFRSATLPAGQHVAVVRNLGERNPASVGTVVGFDRAEVFDVQTGPPPGANRSGKPWLSGVNGDPRMIPADVDEFCRQRGAPCDVSLVYVGRNDWSAVTRPTYLFDAFRNWPGRLAIAVPPYPERSGGSLPVCASGAYDAHWRAFGQTLNDYGRQNSIIHLAWEANGNWFEWSATNPTAYVNCWRRIANAINSTADPDPTLAWIVNAHYSQNPPSHNPLDIYPGDAWVDAIGLDAYDHYPASRTRAEFNQQANTMGGINWLYNFSRARGKMFAVGEWGVVSGPNGGGDNPNYIDWMYEWFVDHQEFLLFENYFTNCDPGNVGSNLFRPFSDGGTPCLYRNPNAAFRYQALW